MDIWIDHYKVTSEINFDQYFDLEDYEESSSLDLHRS